MATDTVRRGAALRFGVGPAGIAFLAPGELRDKVRELEDLGYDSVCLSDHLDGRASPGPTAVAVASWTERLRVAVHVYCNDLRPPAVLAHELETIARLVDGRFEAGLGAGWLRSDYERAGIEFAPAGRRVERLQTSVQLIREALTASDAPPVPLMIGGGGPKVLALAGREADIVGLNLRLPKGTFGAVDGASASAAASAEKVGWVREAAGERFDALELQMTVHVLEITDDRAAALDRAAASLGVPVEDAARSPHVLVGSVAEVTERIEATRATLGVTYFCVPAAGAVALGPVVAELAGR
jgi:probable F420-dependent oxidoreductase